MGYSYGRTASGGWALSCDSCGVTGGVRKRTCTARVVFEDGRVLPYCPAPALCGACLTKHGGARTIHAACQEPAARFSAECARKAARIAGGDLQVLSAYGSWHETVPDGMTGVIFGRGRTTEDYRDAVYQLVPADDYHPGTKGFLSDYPAAAPWAPHA